jgi:hypothetical protein
MVSLWRNQIATPHGNLSKRHSRAVKDFQRDTAGSGATEDMLGKYLTALPID